MAIKKEKINDLIKTILGIFFAILIAPIALLVFIGIGTLIKLLFARLPNLVAVLLIALILILISLLTAFSRIYLGGGTTKMVFKNFYKRKEKKKT